jgi:hypothetical protein
MKSKPQDVLNVVVEDGSKTNPVKVIVEFGPEALRAIAEVQASLLRIADHFDPPPPDVIDSRYLADRLGVSTTRIAQRVRGGSIPASCIVPGSGDGRLWKFHRRRIEEWLAKEKGV